MFAQRTCLHRDAIAVESSDVDIERLRLGRGRARHQTTNVYVSPKASDPIRPHIDREVRQTVLAFVDCIVSSSSAGASRPAAAEHPPPPPPARFCLQRPIESACMDACRQDPVRPSPPSWRHSANTRHRLMGPCLWPHPTVGTCEWPQTWHGLNQRSDATSVSCAAYLDCVYND